MVVSIVLFNSQRSCHAINLGQPKQLSNSQDLTPLSLVRCMRGSRAKAKPRANRDLKKVSLFYFVLTPIVNSFNADKAAAALLV